MKHVNDRVPPPSTRKMQVPEILDSIVTRATYREPRDRYSDASAMAAELDAAATSLEVGGDTDVIMPEEEEGSVWPIPGTRYDPHALGRRVIAVLIGLAAVALALLVWRIATAGPDDEGTDRSAAEVDAAGSSPRATDSPTNDTTTPAGFTLDDYAGLSYKDVESELTDAGLSVVKEEIDNEAPKDTILAQSPEAGAVVPEGRTVTLTVSTGKLTEEEPPEEDKSGPSKDNPGKAKGHDKKGDD
jgi:hypothetical protein